MMKEKNLEIKSINTQRKFCCGDIHGGYRALKQCLERSNFDKENDLLITLGDICDGWSETYECVEELLTIKNRIDIRGNHDQWLVNWFKFGDDPYIWKSQGGYKTIKSYEKNGIKESHIKFFNNQHFYYVDDENRLFVHGGFNWHLLSIKDDKVDNLMWDRHLYETACYWESFSQTHPSEVVTKIESFSEVFIGHTSTLNVMNWRLGPSEIPHHVSNVWNLDQGGGREGKLSIMNIDTKEFWQSDIVKTLYPEEKGRD